MSGKFGDGILVPIKIKFEDTTFSLGFKPTWKNIKEMIVEHRQNLCAKAAGQTSEAPLKFPHMSYHISSPLLYLPASSIRASVYEWEIWVDAGLQNNVLSTTADLPGDDLDRVTNLEDEIFMIEKESPPPPFFHAESNSGHVRRWESIPIITPQSSARQWWDL